MARCPAHGNRIQLNPSRAVNLFGATPQPDCRWIAVDQVWATNITYIPLQKGFLYQVGILDLHSRHVLSWKLSNSLDTEFCLKALEMALSSGRRPEIFHSDQGCQFTSGNFVARLQAKEIKFSWSGRKRCYDNILVERLWRTQVRGGLPACLQRWLGGRNQSGSLPVEVLPCKASQFTGRSNSPCGIH